MTTPHDPQVSLDEAPSDIPILVDYVLQALTTIQAPLRLSAFVLLTAAEMLAIRLSATDVAFSRRFHEETEQLARRWAHWPDWTPGTWASAPPIPPAHRRGQDAEQPGV